MSQDPEAPKPSEPQEPTNSEGDAAAERPKYTPPSYVPPVSLDKDRENLTEPIPPGPMQGNPTIPLPPGAPPLPGTPQQPGQQGLGAQGQSAYQAPRYQPSGAPAYGSPASGSQNYGNQPQTNPGQPAQPYGQAAPYGQAQYGQTPYAQPPGQYGQAQPYGPGQPYAQPYGYGYAPPEPKGLSIAAMVCGIAVYVGFGVFILPQIAAVVLGHMGLSREPSGRPMALAGLIMGYVGIALTVIFFAILAIALGTASNSRYNY